jgi:ribosome-binding ATPase YchF (GTP1/OBG family)
VPDNRLEELAEVFQPTKITHATMEYLDFPSISKDALREPKYLASMRLADSLAHVLRLFADDTVPHEKGALDPVRDLEDIEIELILSDLMMVEKRLERLEKDRRKIKSADLDHEFEVLTKSRQVLEDNKPLRAVKLNAED